MSRNPSTQIYGIGTVPKRGTGSGAAQTPPNVAGYVSFAAIQYPDMYPATLGKATPIPNNITGVVSLQRFNKLANTIPAKIIIKSQMGK